MAQSTEEVAEQLARHVVHGVAPEEDEIFDLVAAAWRRDPGRLADRATRDEMLGFGVEAALTLLTPVALGAATEVLRYLATETADALELQNGWTSCCAASRTDRSPSTASSWRRSARSCWQNANRPRSPRNGRSWSRTRWSAP